jgi:Big-like domain-containing protein
MLVLAGCAGGSRSVPSAPSARALDSFKVPAGHSVAAPPPPPAMTPRKPSTAGRSTSSNVAHPAFFAGEAALTNGVYYLALPNGNPFGYYSYLPDARYIYHFDLGYQYLYDANDGQGGIYLYDFASGHWWYTGREYPFPFVYDFSLGTMLYYYPAPGNPGHYTTQPRYFYDFGISQIVGSTALDPTYQGQQALATVSGYGGATTIYASNVPAGTSVDALTSIAPPIALPTFPPYRNTSVTPTALAYVTLTPSQTFALSYQPDFSITVPAGANARTGYQLEFATANTAQKPVTWKIAYYAGYDSGGGLFQFQGDSGAVPLVAGQPYVCAFLSVPQVVVTPSHLALVGIGTTGKITVSEPQYNGSFTAVSSNPSFATIADNGDGTFTVTAVAVGYVTITITDSRGLSSSATVSVSTISLGVS